MSKHTPGPWEVMPGPVGVFYIDQTSAKDLSIAMVFRLAEVDANARLIAAAPTMLAKLREIAAECANCQGARCADCADIWQVIDQAEGAA